LFALSIRGAGRKEAALRLLNPIVEYDAQNHTDLLETLWTFVLSDRDRKETARRLHLHRNSLRYRFCKIGRLLSENSLSGVGFHRLFLALLAYFEDK
jgi:purine catabolism regulator